MNLAARFGGDEFLALLTEADSHGAAIFVQRVRKRFMRVIEKMNGDHRLSVAAGVAEYDPMMSRPEDLVAAADRALYRAKNARVRT
jgi:diguanylate cyclase (GGDEF)-like protein